MNKNFKFFVVLIGVVIIALIFYDQFANQKLVGVSMTNAKTSISTTSEKPNVELTKLNSTNIKKSPGYIAYIKGNALENTKTTSNKVNTLYFQNLTMDYPNYIHPKEIVEKKSKDNSTLYSFIKLGNLNEKAPFLEVAYTSKNYNTSTNLKTLYTDFLNLKIDTTDTDVTLEKTKNSVLYMDLSNKNYLFKKVVETSNGNYYIFYNGLSSDHNINDILNSINIKK